jgi:hypothetical protein
VAPAWKFTPENVERIKDWIAQGLGRDQIASRLGVSVGSLQATCSRLGIGLRLSAGVQRSIEHVRRADHAVQVKLSIEHVRRADHAVQVKLSIEHVRQADHAVQVRLTLLMETRDRQAAFDVPLPQDVLVQLALAASVRDLTTADLIGKIVNQAMEKDLVGEILGNGSSPSSQD